MAALFSRENTFGNIRVFVSLTNFSKELRKPELNLNSEFGRAVLSTIFTSSENHGIPLAWKDGMVIIPSHLFILAQLKKYTDKVEAFISFSLLIKTTPNTYISKIFMTIIETLKQRWIFLKRLRLSYTVRIMRFAESVIKKVIDVRNKENFW